MCRFVVTALKPVRAEQVRRPEWKQNWTVPHCGSVLPICLSLRPVASIHISSLAAREQTSAAQIAKASPLYNMKYFDWFLALSFNSVFNFFWLKWPSTSARTAHHATVFYDTRYFMLSTNFKIDEPRLNSAHTSYALQKMLDICISESNVPLNQFLILVLYTYIVCLFILYASSLILFFCTFFLTYLLTYLLFPLRIDPLRFPAVVYFVLLC